MFFVICVLKSVTFNQVVKYKLNPLSAPTHLSYPWILSHHVVLNHLICSHTYMFPLSSYPRSDTLKKALQSDVCHNLEYEEKIFTSQVWPWVSFPASIHCCSSWNVCESSGRRSQLLTPLSVFFSAEGRFNILRSVSLVPRFVLIVSYSPWPLKPCRPVCCFQMCLIRKDMKSVQDRLLSRMVSGHDWNKDSLSWRTFQQDDVNEHSWAGVWLRWCVRYFKVSLTSCFFSLFLQQEAELQNVKRRLRTLFFPGGGRIWVERGCFKCFWCCTWHHICTRVNMSGFCFSHLVSSICGVLHIYWIFLERQCRSRVSTSLVLSCTLSA